MAHTPILPFLFLLVAFWGAWKLALVGALALAAHEVGHAIAFWAIGVGVKQIRFGLIVGFTEAAKPVHSHAQLAPVALAGPGSGLIQASLVFAIYYVWSAPWLLVVVAFVAGLNLMNCIPIGGFDGGRVWSALISRLGPLAQYIAFFMPVVTITVALVALQRWNALMTMLSIVLVGLAMFPQSLRRPKHKPAQNTEAGAEDSKVQTSVLSWGHILPLALAYAGVIAGLMVIYVAATHAPLYDLDTLR